MSKSQNKFIRYKFPSSFKFGVGSSAYQIEGSWNEDGKSESTWDYQTHNFPAKFTDYNNADITCDAYRKYAEDISNLKLLHVDFYRFSLSWCRILPTGFPNQINEPGIAFYKQFIKKLVDNGIEPVVTLYHGDLPQSLELLGGWTNPIMADFFVNYARVCFEHFGDKVKWWITQDSPNQLAQFGYGDCRIAPFTDSDGIGSYLAAHTLLLAHAKAYQVYKTEFHYQAGMIGIALESPWYEPYTTNKEDTDAAERMLQMYLGWFADPIFSQTGDYPTLMRQRVDANSAEQGFLNSRLPQFSPDEVNLVRGSADFFGLNHFCSYYVTSANVGLVPSNDNDIGAHYFIDEHWKKTGRPFQRVLPWGLYQLLRWITERYRRPQVFITANGYSGHADEDFNDTDRIEYVIDYLKEILKAMKDHDCHVSAYTLWSFMDCFEWTDAYSIRSGVYYVDFNDPNRKRKAKRSVYVYRNIIVTHRVVESSIDISTAVDLPAISAKRLEQSNNKTE